MTSRRTARGLRLAGGFTIVDLMVTIGVMSVLLGITLPALMGARNRSRELVCVANLHGLAQTVLAYAQEHKGRYLFEKGGDGKQFPSTLDRRGSVTIPHAWSLEIQWTFLLFDTAPWDEYFATWLCPGAPRTEGKPWISGAFVGLDGQPIGNARSSYNYSHSFVASPSVWSGDSDADEALIRPILVSEVAYPANKVMFWDSEMGHLSVRKRTAAALDRRPMLFADGHAAVMRMSEASEPVVNPFTGQARRLVDTRDGVDGVDYR